MITVLRPYWKCLQHLNVKDTTGLSEYLEAWDKNYRQNVKFYDTENPPEKFDLTGFYPLWDKPDEIRLDKEIDTLIKETDLFVPLYKSCICLTETEAIFLEITNASKALVLNEKRRVTNFGNVIESVCARESSSGLSILYSDNSDTLSQLESEILSGKEKHKRIEK